MKGISRWTNHGIPFFDPRAVLVGCAVCNYMVVYMETQEVVGWVFCFYAPWYVSPQLAQLPLLILIAALGCYSRKWRGYLAGVAFSAPVVYQGVVDAMPAWREETYLSWVGIQPGLCLQYALAALIMCLAVSAAAREMRVRASLVRAA